MNTRAGRERRRNRLVALLGGRCVRCGYDRSPDVLKFYAPGKVEHVCITLRRKWKVEEMEVLARRCVLLCPTCREELKAGLWKLTKLENKQ